MSQKTPQKSNLQKFSFELSFDEVLTEHEVVELRQREIEESFRQGELKGLEEGEKIGYQRAQESIQKLQLDALNDLSKELTSFFNQMDTKRDENACLSLDLIKRIGQKFFIGSLLEEKLNNIEKALRETISLVVEEEKIVFYVQDELVESMQQLLENASEFTGLVSRLSFAPLASKNNQLGLIQWKKGEVEIHPEALWEKITSILENYSKHTQKQMNHNGDE